MLYPLPRYNAIYLCLQTLMLYSLPRYNAILVFIKLWCFILYQGIILYICVWRLKKNKMSLLIYDLQSKDRINTFYMLKGFLRTRMPPKVSNEMKSTNEKMTWDTQDTNLRSYVPKANEDHTISGQGIGISILPLSHLYQDIMLYICVCSRWCSILLTRNVARIKF